MPWQRNWPQTVIHRHLLAYRVPVVRLCAGAALLVSHADALLPLSQNPDVLDPGVGWPARSGFGSVRQGWAQRRIVDTVALSAS